MALHDDLLEQAAHLASREPKKPRQASLRRAVSAAYYALFHLLAAEGARKLAPPQPPQLRFRIRRGFDHRTMKDVCKSFSSSNPPEALKSLLTLPIEPDLVTVATALIALQEARHEADYDLTASVDRVEVLQRVEQARSAFARWKAVRSRPNATVFLAALLLERQWR